MGAARGGGCGIAVAPPAAGEAAEGLTFSLTLASLFAILVSWGLLIVWNNTFGPLLIGLADALKIDVWRVHVDPAGKLRDLDHLVIRALQKSIAASDLAFGYWLHQSARLQLWIADEVWKLSRDTGAMAEWLVKKYGPTLLKTAGTVLFPWAKLYRVIDSEIEKYLPKVKHGTKGAVDGVEAKIGKLLRPLTVKEAADAVAIAGLWAAFGAIAGTIHLPGRVGSLPHGIGIPKSWWKWRSKVDRRLHKLEVAAGATVMAGLMANVLGVSARCLRKGNVGKLSRLLCGLDSGLFDLLFLGVFEAFVVTDLCLFSDLLIKQAEALVPSLMKLVDVEDALIGCHGTVKPMPFDLPAARLPPLQGVSPLAA